jgi:inorganic triphosphatase YgiF
VARIREVEFELVSGSPGAMVALVERWRKRFGLIYDPRSKAERGDRLAQGFAFPPVRTARRPDGPRRATATQALGAALDECLAQITHNAIGVCEGDPALRVEHVHQLRIGIRRLRSALRRFAGGTTAPPPHLVDGLRALSAALGVSGDRESADVVRSDTAQRLFLAWIAWRAALAEQRGGD